MRFISASTRPSTSSTGAGSPVSSCVTYLSFDSSIKVLTSRIIIASRGLGEAASSHPRSPPVKSFARAAPLDLYSRSNRAAATGPLPNRSPRACDSYMTRRSSPEMTDEIRRLLKNGQETIVRTWTEKVAADRRVKSDDRLSYLQLVDHIPQIVEELHDALGDGNGHAPALTQGREHGRQRWRQGYELKEVVRELTLLRVTLVEFIE